MFAHKTEEYRQYMKSIEDRETHMSKLNMQLEQLESEKGGYESELGSSMASQLTENEHNELKNLNMKIQETAKEFENVTNKRIDIEKKKNRIETLLSENLCKREEQLKRNMEQLEDAERKSKLTEALDSFKRLEFQTKDIQDREEQIRVSLSTRDHKFLMKLSNKTIQADLSALEAEQRQLKEHVDEYRNLERTAQQELVDVDKDFDKMASKESIYLEKSVCYPLTY